MTERPIIFSGAMVRALLAGRKTQTRRVVDWPDWARAEELAEMLREDPEAYANGADPQRRLRCPHGRRGDRLWVRETWSPVVPVAASSLPASYGALALAHAAEEAAYYKADGTMLPPQSRWHLSTHMPRHLSRILLTITEVRIERLQEISMRDALAEGLERVSHPGEAIEAANDWFRPYGWAKDGSDRARMVFADLWDSMNAARGNGWKTNPWVWAIRFEIDASD